MKHRVDEIDGAEQIKFFDSPPPHVGWWMTTIHVFRWWRYWDGENWSRDFCEHEKQFGIEVAFSHPSSRIDPDQSGIQWSSYYPANARVPRIDPGVSTAP